MHGDSKWSNVRLRCARDRYAEPVAKIGWFGSLSRDVAGRNDVRQVNQVIEAFRRDEGRTFAADYAAAHKQYPAKGVHKQIPKGRFCLVFFAIYLFQYAVFGLLYYLQAEHCIKGVKHYLHALWFSVQTAATIGYGGDLSPDPYCSVTNALVTCQVIISLLTDYSMLGIVFTRFANPSSRTSTIRFSKQMAMTHHNGIWRLTFRVANVRKHQILRPEIRILLLRFNSKHPDADDAGYLHQELQITSGGLTPSKIAWLGLPTSMSHIIDADSPLSGMMPADMEQEDMEILVLLDGIDATTSGVLQARCSYQPSDIQLNEKFRPVVRRASDGMLTVNFAAFDLLSNTGPETPADLEVGQASELVALAQGPSSTYVPAAAESSWLSGYSKSQSQIRLQQLQALCAAIRMDDDISDNIRSVCAALYENLSTADQE